MPISRYEIRNEYSLADPELYQAADKDDPEALLEGVAMAGLVGVLRQLGDLAEFAAEIFHDLHEEVMATAARGHSLMIRVQQLEAEVPSIEKAFLSQTDHSSFFYNAGVDWHPNSRITQNLVTQGDLPRFVMDSYEECRGPPRLFLLDKFDVAGAGACLKRYTDPSFFKVETSAMANTDVRREKKIRKSKKKGPRGAYGETLEGLPASHAKLHRLFLEEPDEHSVRKRAHRAKLKRRLNGFPFDSKTGKSYMEKLLKSPSPEHKILHEITASSPLFMSTNGQNEADLDVLELRSVRTARGSEGRKINYPPPIKADTVLTPLMNQTDDKSVDIKSCDVPSYLNVVTDDIPSTFDEENDEKDITVYGEGKTEGSLTGYQSDEIASEIDNYMDAPSTIESEMDTDSELRVKNDFTTSNIKSQPSVSVESEEHLHSQSSDSQSNGDLTISNEGSNSSKKEVCSFISSDSSRTSAEHLQSSSERFPSSDIPEIALVNASAYQKTADEISPRDGLPNNRTGSEQLNSDLSTSNSIPVSLHNDPGVVVRKDRLMGSKPVKTASNLDDEGEKTDLIIDSQCPRRVSSSKSLSGDDSPRSSSGEHLVDGEDAPCRSNISDIICHTSDSPAAVSAYLLPEDDSDLADLNQLGNMSSTLDMSNVLSQNRINTEEIITNESTAPGKLENEVSKFPENFASDFTDTADSGEDITSKVPEGEKQNDNLHIQESTVVSDAPNRFSSIMGTSIGKEFIETSFTNAETDSEEHYSNSLIVKQISSEALIVSGGLDAHDRDFISEKGTTIHEVLELEPPNSCEVVGLQGTGMTDDVTPNDRVALKSSFCTPENLEEPPGTSNSDAELGCTQFDSPSDLELRSEVHVLLDESESKTDKSETAFSDRGNVGLPIGIHKSVEEHISYSEDSGLGEHKDHKTSLSGSNIESELVEEDENYHGQSDLVEEVDEKEAASLDYRTVYDQPKSEVPDTVFNSYLDSEIEQSVGFLDTAQIQSPLEQSGLVTDHDSFLKNGVENQLYVTAETVVQEKIELPSNKIDQESPDSGEISTELASLLPINHQKILDHDNDEGHNKFASSFPLVNYPPSVSADAYPKDPLGIVFPPSTLFSETNQINLDELPPLPPLPPMQWRMGMLQHASSTTELKKTEHKEVFPQEISPSATSTGNLSSSLEPRNHSLVQIIPQISVKEENVVQSSPSLEANSMHGEKIDLPPKMENEQQQQFVMPTQMSNEVASSALLACDEIIPVISLQEKNVEQSSPSIEANSMHETIVLPPKIKSEEQQQQLVTPTQKSDEIFPQTSLKEENVQESSSRFRDNSMHETTDLPPKIEKEQQLAMPTPKSDEVASSADEDGVAHGSRTMKLPWSCNPLIGSVAALDKSKLRKVTARDRPQIQKPEERDSLLEQIRTKSFSLKPAVPSRPITRGPNTNLKVAAILEKANAIRQALAGSDEDDEDNWSDS
ncbi:hypothetical protein ACS0TY_016456 [Phlomoides rotata]